MSNVYLPNQNDKYWGYALNNYLQSLAGRVTSLEQNSSSSHNISVAMGPGFSGRTSSFSVDSDKMHITSLTTNIRVPEVKVSGEVIFGATANNEIIRSKTLLTNHYIFQQPTESGQVDTVYYTVYQTTSNSYAMPTSSDLEDILQQYYFLNVYLWKNNNNIYTVIAGEFIFRDDMVMVGTLEFSTNTNTVRDYTFIPRVFDNSKTLFQTSKDTLTSYATLNSLSFDGSALPTKNNFYNPSSTEANFLFGTNGINPGTPTNTNIHALNSLDIKTDRINDATTIVIREAQIDQLENTIELTDVIDDLDDTSSLAYYVAPSGNIYIQRMTNRPTFSDEFSVEAREPLSQHKYMACGSLVYIGTVVKDTEDIYVWYRAKGNGVSPTIIDNNNWTPVKVILNKIAFYSPSNRLYEMQLTSPSANHAVLSISDKEAHPSEFQAGEITLKAPKVHFKTDNETNGSGTFQFTDGLDDNGTYANILLNSGQAQLRGGATSTLQLRPGDTNGSQLMLYADSSDTYIKFLKNAEGTSSVISGTDTSIILRPSQELGFTVAYDGTLKKVVATVTGNSVVTGTHTVAGSTTLNSVTVDGTSTFNNHVDCQNRVSTTALTVRTTSSFDGDITCNGNALMKKGLNIQDKIYYTPDPVQKSVSLYEDRGSATLVKPVINDSNYQAYVSTDRKPFTIVHTSTKKQIDDSTYSYTYSSTTNVFSLYDSNGDPYTTATLTYYQEASPNLVSKVPIECADIRFTSDRRLKTNLQKLDALKCYEAVQQLDVQSYTYKHLNYDTLGLIAQEIEEVLPEYAHLLISEDKDGYKTVSEHKLLFILWEALKYEIKKHNSSGN